MKIFVKMKYELRCSDFFIKSNSDCYLNIRIKYKINKQLFSCRIEHAICSYNPFSMTNDNYESFMNNCFYEMNENTEQHKEMVKERIIKNIKNDYTDKTIIENELKVKELIKNKNKDKIEFEFDN